MCRRDHKISKNFNKNLRIKNLNLITKNALLSTKNLMLYYISPTLNLKFHKIYTSKVIIVWKPKIINNLVTQLTFHLSWDSYTFSFYRQTLIMDYFFFTLFSLFLAEQLLLLITFNASVLRTDRNAISNIFNKIINTQQGQRLLLLVHLRFITKTFTLR